MNSVTFTLKVNSVTTSGKHAFCWVMLGRLPLKSVNGLYNIEGQNVKVGDLITVEVPMGYKLTMSYNEVDKTSHEERPFLGVEPI